MPLDLSLPSPSFPPSIPSLPPFLPSQLPSVLPQNLVAGTDQFMSLTMNFTQQLQDLVQMCVN